MALQARQFLSSLSSLARARLARAYEGNAARQVILCTLLARILDALPSLSKPPILLKGLAYAYDLYPNPNIRVVGDIDLLIEPEEVNMVLEQLVSKGFQRVHAPILLRHGLVYKIMWRIGLEARHQQIMSRVRGPVQERQTGFIGTIGGTQELVEIHYGLINLFPTSIKGKIFRTQQELEIAPRVLSIEGHAVQVLDHESAFLHAVRHLALHHKLVGFLWHYDIALMLVLWRDSLRPECVLEKARMLGSHKIVRVELAILEELFGPTIFHAEDRKLWLKDRLPLEYPLYRRVILKNGQTLLKELVRPLLAPSVKAQISALFSQSRVELSKL